MTMTRHASANRYTLQNIKSREQRGRAIALVIMRHGPGAPLLQRQAWLRAIKRLNLAFLVNTKYQRVVRWVHIETNDILKTRDKLGIVG